MEKNNRLSERLRVKISLAQSDAIDALSIRTGLNRSEITRAAISFFLDSMRFYSTKGVLELYENTTDSGAPPVVDVMQPDKAAR